MGSAQSTPMLTPAQRAATIQQRPRQQEAELYTSLDEKFDVVRISNHTSSSRKLDSSILSSNPSHVSSAKTEAYIHHLLQDSKNRLALSALSTANPNAVLEKPSAIAKDTQFFNLTLPHEGSPVTNQRSSGRCWIFAACNVFRIAIQQKYNIKSFELSQSYLFFWDKVEKANYFLESILGTADEDIGESRLISALMASPVGDGGQWDMVVNLVAKYGIVPQSLYPVTWNAMNSGVMDRLLTTKLREHALTLRECVAMRRDKDAIAAKKEEMMQDVVRILTLCLGPPPSRDEKFMWEFYDSKNVYKTVEVTPLEFADTTHVKKFISLTNDPRNEYNRLLTVSHLGNVWEGRPITYVNVDKIVLKEACVAMLKKGLPIFFGSDVGKQSDSYRGIMDTDLIDYELGFNTPLNLTKAQRLLTGESQMTHAMVLTAVHLDVDSKPVRWRVENSWSASAGTEGYFVMSDKWMDEFCYQAVVDPSVVHKDVRDVLGQKAKVLPLWDPMGALA
ncbi:bleomycin hydrolase [Vermiconidia calcicola]|uniref:Bleomycin hydrolase n=1 Tax=Vermiconidia calcicola TaxID=1690605 RepID=A0ACC3MYT0_9PEZI|nr:bleomycin hydrolase [Vermiconidia calcicola]